jgi:acyl-CoA synthetase (NDP forming)
VGGASDLLRTAYPLAGDPARACVPEPFVKAWLRDLGVATPRGAVAGDPAELKQAAAALRAPLALKAFGPGIVHKNTVGAVRLGLDSSDLPGAATDIGERLARHGTTAAGFLIEEQHAPGIEWIAGVLGDGPFGATVSFGLGGRFAEYFDRLAMRLCPLDARSADELLGSFPGPVDRAALRAFLLAIAGSDGVAVRLGGWLAEFECNPVIATPDGVVALDARLILHREKRCDPPAPPAANFARLFAPRSVAVAGASTQRPGFGNRFLDAYRRNGWSDGLHAIHPEAASIDGVPAAPSTAQIEGGVDYLLVAVPAARCAGVIAESAGHVRFAQVISGGFSESGAEGAALEADLVAAARRAGVRMLGPNCMGVFSPRGRQTFQRDVPTEPGGVSVISQSGGLAGDILQAGNRQGVRFARLASVGNCADVGAGELLEWLVDDPETHTIGLYLEGARDGERLLRGMRRAAGKKPIVVLAGGSSLQGARAAASHTGALAHDARIWTAVQEATGVSLARSLEEFLAALAFLDRHASAPVAADRAVLVVGPGGGASVLAADACDRAGLELAPVGGDAEASLRARGYGAGTSLANPVELPVGPAAAPDALREALAALLERRRFPDALVHVNVQSYYGYGDQGAAPLCAAIEQIGAAPWPARIAFVLRNLPCASAGDAEAIRAAASRARLACFTSLDDAAQAIAAAKRFTAFRRRTPS